MAEPLRYDPSAAHLMLTSRHLRDVAEPLRDARSHVWNDVELFNSGASIPEHLQPLDAGFIELPERLLNDDASDPDPLLKQIDRTAELLRSELDRVVVLGIGGSYMGMRALFEALRHPYHNELERSERDGIPRLYFEGNNVDSDATAGLLELLKRRSLDPADPAQRWGIVVISKSGGTLETAISFRLFRDALTQFYGADSDAARRYVVPITGPSGKLRTLAQNSGYPADHIFPIPDGVGGRFSILTSVGLLPAAVMGMDVRQLLLGAADMTRLFREAPLGQNPVLDFVATCHLLEAERGCNIRILSTWGKRLEALGLWYDQLLAESLGKDEYGATPLTVVNTRDLHSRGQQHQEGERDKLITNVIVEAPSGTPLAIPRAADDADGLNRLASRTLPDVLSAAIRGTNQAYRDVFRPTADIVLPKLNEYYLGQLLQMLMLATVVEGRLIGINPYGQPGVEAYKKNTNAILDEAR